jgi:hydroxymethylpyrimidine pyrophosphatase-like HAD family hydrolase
MTIQQILKDLNIEKYTIHDDGSVTAHQDVIILSNALTKIPIKFKEVKGSFSCSNNNLTSLVNAPQIIEGDFSCSFNQLTSLIGAPQKVKFFDCSFNHLTNLIGAPQTIKGLIIH